jgi:hypothetical protein
MTNKYFNYSGAPWQIIETTDPWGKSRTIAIEMDSTDGAMLNTEEYSEGSDWEYVEASAVRIDEWFLRSDPNDLFIGDDEYNDNFLEDQQRYVDMMSNVQSMSNQSSRLKEMLEGLRNPPFDESNRTVGAAEDILGMIRARQDTVEMPHTVILNESKYTNSVNLEKAISEMKKQHGDNAYIRIGPHNAEHLLLSMQNHERLGISSLPPTDRPLGIALDQEILSLIQQLPPKK